MAILTRRRSVQSTFCLLFLAAVHVSLSRGQFSDRAATNNGTFDRLPENLVGAARIVDGRLRLTPPLRQLAGAAWFSEKRRIVDGFDATFEFQFTEQGGLGNGADGLAFVLQNQGTNAIAGRGSAGGFAPGDGWHDLRHSGIPHSIAVFLDTFRNDDGLDPSDNYLAITTNGSVHEMLWPPQRLGIGRRLKVKLKDGQVHTARIRYRPPLMSVYLDEGEPDLRIPVDVSTIADEAGAAYLGFTAATGNGYENHDVLGFRFTPVRTTTASDMSVVDSNIIYLRATCLEGRNLCTPSEAIVEDSGPNRYHVILPAHLAWGASIANPTGLSPKVTNPQGHVCWDRNNDYADGCNGPDGTSTMRTKPAGKFLVPSGIPGSLVSKTEHGRTFFSVNGLKGKAFRANEGAFEFDVELR